MTTATTSSDKDTTTALQNDFAGLSVQRVADIAANAHNNDDNEEDDAPSELLPSFPSRGVGRHSSFGGPRGRMPPRRAQSLMSNMSRGGASGDFTPAMPGRSRGEPLRGVGRSNSLRAGNSGPLLSRARAGGAGSPRRAPPGRSVSTDSFGGLRGSQVNNVSIASNFDRKDRSVVRTTSGDSFVSMSSDMDGSCFTTDSINLRKTQLVADPLLDGNYYTDDYSCADHESVYGTMSTYTEDFDGYSEYGPEGMGGASGHYPRSVVSVGDLSFATMDSLGIQRLHLEKSRQQHQEANAEGGEGAGGRSRSDSFSTLASNDMIDDLGDLEGLVDDDDEDEEEETMKQVEAETPKE